MEIEGWKRSWRIVSREGRRAKQCHTFAQFSIIVRFKAPVQISEFKFKPLDDPITWPSEITLFFSETVEEGNEQVNSTAGCLVPPDMPIFQVLTILHSNNMDRLTYPIVRST